MTPVEAAHKRIDNATKRIDQARQELELAWAELNNARHDLMRVIDKERDPYDKKYL